MSPAALQFKGQKVLVFGLGLQGGGEGDALWLAKEGAKVRVTDLKNSSQLASTLSRLPPSISLALGSHRDEDIAWADLVIKNPGVPDDQPHILLAEKLGKPVYTSIALVVQAARDKVVGVTGTRGKSTTTELIYLLLASAYPGLVAKGGNIPSTSPLSLLDHLEDLRYLVLELSSFQLHNFHDLQVSPHVAVFTNLYPDHLNRYPDLEAYARDKEAIFAYQQPGDIAIRGPLPDLIPPDWHIKLPGAHNRENLACLLAVSRALGISDQLAQKIAESFTGLPYRLQTIAVKKGVTYVNDTTSTTPTSTLKAIASLSAPTTIIVGGADKKLPTSELVDQLASNPLVRGIILLGSRDIPHFTSTLALACPDKILGQVDSMTAAVELAVKSSRVGDTVLLSPGFFSFDLFQNEFDRGLQFNNCVNILPS